MFQNMPGPRILIWFASFFVAIAALVASLYLLFVPGLSSARSEPPEIRAGLTFAFKEEGDRTPMKPGATFGSWSLSW
jgi:hypothetical protein